MSRDGLQIIEPEILRLLRAGDTGSTLVRLLLTWIVSCLGTKLRCMYPGTTLSVVDVEFHANSAPYPALGVHYEDESIPDCEEWVLDECKTLMQSPINDIVQFVMEDVS